MLFSKASTPNGKRTNAAASAVPKAQENYGPIRVQQFFPTTIKPISQLDTLPNDCSQVGPVSLKKVPISGIKRSSA